MRDWQPWDDEPPPDPEDLPPDPAVDWGARAEPPGQGRPAGHSVPGAIRATPASRRRPPGGRPPTAPTDLRAEALAVLRQLTGDPAAAFHAGQYEAIEELVAHHHRSLVVQRTGWGKSAVYFIAALLQRRSGPGPALILSHLLALMRDQVWAARRAAVR
ncbi:MAG: DEAD/DEAH box helicase, partial [Propionicimonas sp.]